MSQVGERPPRVTATIRLCAQLHILGEKDERPGAHSTLGPLPRVRMDGGVSRRFLEWEIAQGLPTVGGAGVHGGGEHLEYIRIADVLRAIAWLEEHGVKVSIGPEEPRDRGRPGGTRQDILT